MTMPVPKAGCFSVVVISDDIAETAYEAVSEQDALTWAREWMREPLGLAVAILPPA